MQVTGSWPFIGPRDKLTNLNLQRVPERALYLLPEMVGCVHAAHNINCRIYDVNIDDHIADNDRARKHGMEEFIALDPVTADHHNMFNDLQKWSLDWRLKDPYASLVIQ